MRPSLRPSLHCRHCGQRLLYADETPHKLRPRVVRIVEGALWVQCTTRTCRQWCPAPERLRAVLRVVVEVSADAVGCHDERL
jgi:hypothetical protein